MPSGIASVRAAAGVLAGGALGLHPEQPRINQAQLRLMGREGDLFAAPVDTTARQDLQVLDTASANFGLFFFMPDYDTPGDPYHPIR